MPVLYTIGHGPLPLDDLFRRLATHRIRTVLDVRSQPYSRRAPQYNLRDLEAELAASGIAYRWLGDHLGGRPLKPGGLIPIDSPSLLAAGVTEVAGLIGGALSALLCAELDPGRCHRASVLAGEFAAQGFTVLHILADGTTELHQLSLDL